MPSRNLSRRLELEAERAPLNDKPALTSVVTSPGQPDQIVEVRELGRETMNSINTRIHKPEVGAGLIETAASRRDRELGEILTLHECAERNEDHDNQADSQA
jgi:hypothetical protein